MTALLATRAPALFDRGPGGEPTLDELISSAWERLAVRAVAACPVCGDDVFVYRKEVMQWRAPTRLLLTGQRVQFEIGPGRNGSEAQQVRALENHKEEK